MADVVTHIEGRYREHFNPNREKKQDRYGFNLLKRIQNSGMDTFSGVVQKYYGVEQMSKIWIDLDNSPHVPFFVPVIRELEKRGHTVTITARDCFQVCGLADLYGFHYKRIGKHFGKHLLLKIFGTMYRSLQLLAFAHAQKAELALSHGSRSQLVASKMLGIPSVLINDYEHSSGLKFIHPNTFIGPELISKSKRNNGHSRFRSYPGIKEDVYVPDFEPDPRILKDLGIEENSIVATIRPPATEAHYHNPESEKLFEAVVNFIGSTPNARIVMLPRNEKKQGDFIKSRWADWCREGKLIIPENVVNGLNLIWHSDLVVSGGGTMNREAAALGVPVYSIFRGTIGAVDRYLEKENRLTLIESVEDVKNRISVIRRKKKNQTNSRDRRTLISIVDAIEACLQIESDK